ncbi:hypothetical protein GCM10010172_04570 [Paractinoplanes ferrugineus]|uniref:Uncharacterized protein n=1 Tax=Paractinoplanes ferrugineus TaxID=113564 RepID=A0A919JBL4_9ACTN|nr:hypothetical protein [Actinoplanes ferrugineus]GIE16842.1 hypothetical protein Afe05nite_86820 [Actinoplanes ferrugineus]
MSADDLRPMREDSTFTCDWGYCDEESVAERFDPASGRWLAVCRKDSTVSSDHRQSPGRAHCTECCGEYALTVDGKMRLHSRRFARCPGSGRALPPGSPVVR